MELNDALKYIEKEPVFIKWRKSHKTDYISTAFKLLMDNKDDDWQIGFYNKKNDTITTFILEDGKVLIREDEEVFKPTKRCLEEVKLEELKTSFNSVLENAESYKNKKYPREASIKIIAILQNLKDFGLVWNITFITAGLNALNMKIGAKTGKIIEEKLEPIISFSQKMP